MAVGKSGGNSGSRYGSLSRDTPMADQATWEDASAEDLWRTIIAVTNAGDGLTLSKTRDGGALSLVILTGDDRIRKYCRGEEDTANVLREIRASLEATD